MIEYTFCLFKSQRVMDEPSPLMLAKRLTPMVLSEENERALI